MDIETLNAMKECLRYDGETGKFYWIKKPTKYSKVTLGTEAGGSNTKYRYTLITFLGQKVYAHRLAWFFVTGSFPTKFIDHINGNGEDNRIENLREVERSGNSRNQAIHRSGKVPGVFRTDSGRFQVIKRIKNKNYYLGVYDSNDEAYQVFVNFTGEKA